VFAEWKQFQEIYGDVAKLPTHLFLNPMQEGDEVELCMAQGKSTNIRLVSLGQARGDGSRTVTFEVNGERWFMPVTDASVITDSTVRRKAKGDGEVGSPMPGVIVALKVKEGDIVEEGDPVATLSAMKMETVIPATKSGVVNHVTVNIGDKVEGDDLLVEIS